MVKLISSRGRTPLEFLASIYQAEPEQVRARFKLDGLQDAVGLMKEAAVSSLPYIHEKRPMAVQVDRTDTVQIIIGTVPEAAGEDGRGARPQSFTLDATATEIEQNQGDSE